MFDEYAVKGTTSGGWFNGQRTAGDAINARNTCWMTSQKKQMLSTAVLNKLWSSPTIAIEEKLEQSAHTCSSCTYSCSIFPAYMYPEVGTSHIRRGVEQNEEEERQHFFFRPADQYSKTSTDTFRKSLTKPEPMTREIVNQNEHPISQLCPCNHAGRIPETQ